MHYRSLPNLLRGLASGAIVSAAIAVCQTAHATVFLNFTDCSTLKMPTISSNDPAVSGGPYRLRCKIIDGSNYGFHAATTYENNGHLLDQLPAAGYYDTASLYYITYSDYTHTTVTAIGPETLVPMRVTTDYYYTNYTFGGATFNNRLLEVWGWNLDSFRNPGPIRVMFDTQLSTQGNVYSTDATVIVQVIEGNSNVVWSSDGKYIRQGGTLEFNNLYTPGATIPNNGYYHVGIYILQQQSDTMNYGRVSVSNIRVSHL